MVHDILGKCEVGFNRVVNIDHENREAENHALGTGL